MKQLLFIVLTLGLLNPIHCQEVSNYNFSDNLTTGFRKGNFLYGSDKDSGLYQLDIYTNDLQLFRNSNSEIANFPIEDFVRDEYNNYYFIYHGKTIGSNRIDKLTFFDGNTFDSISHTDLGIKLGAEIRAIDYDPTYGVLIGTKDKVTALKDGISNEFIVLPEELMYFEMVSIPGTTFFRSEIGPSHYRYTNSQLDTLSYDNLFTQEYEKFENKFYSVNEGLLIFENGSFKHITKDNTNLPSKFATEIAVDKNGNIWLNQFDVISGVRYDNGIVKYDGVDFIHYNTSNCGLSSNLIFDLSIDDLGNLIITTDKGISIFNENTIVSQEEIAKIESFILFPNPTSSGINIEFSDTKYVDKHVKIELSDLSGRLIESKKVTLLEKKHYLNLVNQKSGTYMLTISGKGFSFVKRIIKTN
jgi:hypothetical protein